MVRIGSPGYLLLGCGYQTLYRGSTQVESHACKLGAWSLQGPPVRARQVRDDVQRSVSYAHISSGDQGGTIINEGLDNRRPECLGDFGKESKISPKDTRENLSTRRRRNIILAN